MPTAALYARISRDEAGEGLGVERQQQDCRALAVRRGWSVGHCFVDNDHSAYTGRTRPGYVQLVRSIQRGEVQAVVAWAPERLHRSPRELEDFIEVVERAHVTVETVKAGAWDVSTSHGRLVARMLGAVSRPESERTAERVARAHLQARERGLWRGAIPYGLRASAELGAPVVDEPAAVIVREIFERICRGDSLSGIAADLNRRGLKPRRGALWSHTGVRRLVASPALGGLVRVNNELIAAAFEGLIDAGAWRQAQAALARRPRGDARRPPDRLTLLGGILRCAEHDFICYGGSRNTEPAYLAAGPGKCYVSVSRKAADLFVTELIIRRLEAADAYDVFNQRPHFTDTERQLVALRLRRDELASLVADGLLSGAVARERLSGLAADIDELERSRNTLQLAAVTFERPRSVWEAWTQPQRRDVVRLLLSRVAMSHVGQRNGPEVDARRFTVAWAR